MPDFGVFEVKGRHLPGADSGSADRTLRAHELQHESGIQALLVDLGLEGRTKPDREGVDLTGRGSCLPRSLDDLVKGSEGIEERLRRLDELLGARSTKYSLANSPVERRTNIHQGFGYGSI